MKNNTYPFTDIPNILQNSDIQKMIEIQKSYRSMLPKIPVELLENAQMMSQIQQNLSNGLLSLIPALKWAKENQALLQSCSTVITQLQSVLPYKFQISENISWLHSLTDVLQNYRLAHIYPNNISEEECKEIEEVNEIIIDEIFNTEPQKEALQKDSAIIVLSPINDNVLKYLSEHPDTMYQLSGTAFENVMAEVYNKLGYDVQKTKMTRDGGKDIIIRKPDLLGDFILYVECKKYAANRPIGVGIVKNLESTISMDRVNGGIIATTSFFTKDARELILSKNLQYQIKMQDYNDVRRLLNKVVIY